MRIGKIKNNVWVRYLIAYLKAYKLKKYYSEDAPLPSGEPVDIIYMADGKMLHGGLSDRLCGLVSTYNYCIQHHKTFKVLFNSPYELSDYLLPANYNWIMDKDQISYNSKIARPVYIAYYSDFRKQKRITDQVLNSHFTQQHVYTNMRYFENDFSSLFKQLFKPSAKIKELLRYNLGKIQSDFFSVTFRFQQLLGDFKEGSFPQLKTETEKMKLIKQCVETVDKLYKLNNYNKVLITSDSKIFLDEVGRLEYVYVIPGNIVHLDFSEVKDENTHLKSFVDLFMISEARKVYLVYSELLYHSTFAKTAAMMNNRPYEEIKI